MEYEVSNMKGHNHRNLQFVSWNRHVNTTMYHYRSPYVTNFFLNFNRAFRPWIIFHGLLMTYLMTDQRSCSAKCVA